MSRHKFFKKLCDFHLYSPQNRQDMYNFSYILPLFELCQDTTIDQSPILENILNKLMIFYPYNKFNDKITRLKTKAIYEQIFESISPYIKFNLIRVVCDETNNPCHVIDGHDLVVDIYFQFSYRVDYYRITLSTRTLNIKKSN